MGHAVGGDSSDLLFLAADLDWVWAFRASSGTEMDAARTLVPLFPGDDEVYSWVAGFGSDVLGTGADAVWITRSHRDVQRPVFEAIYGRYP